MRLTVIALATLPAAGFAQEAAAPAETLTQPQSCPVGMAWDAGASACTIAAEDTSPAQSLPGGMGCSDHGAAREVTS